MVAVAGSRVVHSRPYMGWPGRAHAGRVHVSTAHVATPGLLGIKIPRFYSFALAKVRSPTPHQHTSTLNHLI